MKRKTIIENMILRRGRLYPPQSIPIIVILYDSVFTWAENEHRTTNFGVYDDH